MKIVVPYAPGGGTDITARLFGDQLKNILGQQFVVENKPGAFGILAIEEMARSKPDGYTLMIGNVSTNAITPVLFKKKFKIDFEKDVAVGRALQHLSVVPDRHHDELRRQGRQRSGRAGEENPGKVRYTSAGVGSFPHYDMEIFARRAGVEMIHIPNKTGAAGMLNDLVVGDAQVAFINSAIVGGDDQGRQAASRSRWSPSSACAAIPTCRPWPRRASRASAPCTGRACWRRRRRRSRSSTRCSRRSSRPSKQPALQGGVRQAACQRQGRASCSDEAKTWLKGELDTWRKITTEVKIDLAE